MSNLTLEQAQEVIGHTFKFTRQDGQQDSMSLYRVVEGRKLPEFEGKTREKSFSMLFRCGGELLEQGSHTLRHKFLGEQEIFLVPLGQDHDGNTYTYQAVFS